VLANPGEERDIQYRLVSHCRKLHHFRFKSCNEDGILLLEFVGNSESSGHFFESHKKRMTSPPIKKKRRDQFLRYLSRGKWDTMNSCYSLDCKKMNSATARRLAKQDPRAHQLGQLVDTLIERRARHGFTSVRFWLRDVAGYSYMGDQDKTMEQDMKWLKTYIEDPERGSFKLSYERELRPGDCCLFGCCGGYARPTGPDYDILISF
jgi:hypothetical protein